MAPSSLKKALGAVKDQTSISIAKVSSNVEPELDVAVIKATSHDPEPADDKHLREILRLTSLSRGLVAACVSAVSRRLSRTRDWVVALKSLSLLHRLLSDGDPTFLHEILHATRPSGARLLNMSDFRDEAHSNSWDHAAFARAYAFYLDQRLECLLFDQKQSENGGHRWQSPSRAIDEESRSVITASRSTPVREMGTEKLLRRLQQLQQLLDRVLACRPSGRAKHNRLILIALYPVVKESFQLYADICDVLAAVLDRFFDMEYRECGKAFEAYVSAAKQIDELSSFYAWCKDTGVARSSEYPDVQRITDQLLGTLEGFMRDQTRRLKSPRREPVVSNPVREEEEEEKPPPAGDLNSIRALPAADDYKEEEPKPEPEIEKPVPVPPVVPTKQEGDLVDLWEDSATADEQGNKLALALFSGPAAAVAANGTGSNGSWEAFPSDGDAKATSAWETPAAEPGKADWELALVETASSLSKQKAALGGGFDPLLLNGMYDQGTVRQHAAAQASGGGSASSAALPAPALRGAAQVLALPAPAPDGTVQVIGGDPFAASLSVAPPAYVQMAEMGKKQQLLVQEQQVWVQYQRDGMQGQVSLAKLDNNGSGYGFVPSPAVPYKMPVGYNGAVYSSYTTY